jgi:hypothetical protein
LKERGFTTVGGEFGFDCWGKSPMLYFEPDLPNDAENDWIEDSLETYIYELLEHNGVTDEWEFIEGTVIIDVANRSFDFDLNGEVREEVETSFTVEERAVGDQ